MNTNDIKDQQQQQQQKKRAECKHRSACAQMTPEEKTELLRRRQENITRRLNGVIEQEMKLKERLEIVSKEIRTLEEASSSPSPSPAPSPATRQLEQLKKRQENITRQLAVIAEKENKPPKMIERENRLKQQLECVSAKIQALEPAEEVSPSPSPSSEAKLEQLKKRQENITRQLAVIAEKENKPPKMIQRENRLKQMLQCVSAKIQALEPVEEVSPSPSPSPSDPKLEQLKKRQENITRQLAVIAEKENKPQKMIERENRLKQQLECVSAKIQALEPVEEVSPSPSPSDRKLEQLKKRQENINFRLSVIAKKENKPQKMIQREKKLNQQLQCVSNKIQAIECAQ